MKAPDKIYLAFEHGFVAQASTSKKDANGNSIFLSKYNPIEYIRKDAILEWAKKEMEKWPSESNTAQSVKMGLTLVMDKIESL